uniref:hypothetical protein n=1 Tax=Ningiella ruwaisensis TaxID=2364274 RepID=UPI00109F6694|nr:hypothetical protein [Ningiella ruwaisensis]
MKCVTTLIFAVIFVIQSSAYAQDEGDRNSSLDRFSEERFANGEELILTLRVENYTFGEIFAVKTEKGVSVEFEGFVQALDFPIFYNDQLNRFEGWFIRLENEFVLQTSLRNTDPLIFNSDVSGKIEIDRGQYQFIDTSLYISSDLLVSWFGIESEIDLQKLEIRLIPQQLLPFQQRLKRKKKQVRQSRSDEVIYPRLQRGFGLLSPQAIDLQLNASYTERNDNVVGSYGLLGGRDVALFNSQFFFSGNQNDWLEIARLQLNKSDENNRLFGINNLSNFEFGDITPVRQANGITAQQSRGFSIDNLSGGTDINLDATSISGEIQIGWDVELYRNGILVAQQFEVNTGRFEFNDIPLDAGLNKFTIRMYGPQGQIIERNEQRLLDRESINTGKLRYRASLTQTDRSLFGIERDNSRLQDDLGYNFSANFQYHLFNKTAINMGVVSQFGGDIQSNQLNLASNTAINEAILLGSNFQISDQGAYLGELSLRTELFGQSIAAFTQYTSTESETDASVSVPLTSEVDNFQALNAASTETREVNLIKREEGISTRLDISGQFRLSDQIGLSYRNELLLASKNDASHSTFRNSLGLTSRFINIFNNLTVINNQLNGDNQFGALSLQKPFGPVMARLNAGYTFDEAFAFNDVRFDLSWSPFEDISTRFVYSRQLDTSTNAYELQTSWNHDYFSLTSVLRQSDAAGFSGGISARLSFGGAPLQYNSVFNTITPLASKGTLLVRVFIDSNVNGIFDADEEVIEGITVTSVQSRRRGETDRTGIAVLSNLPTNVPTDITLDYATVEDPFLVPLIKGVAIKARAGSIDNLDFPLAVSNEIEGQIITVNETGIEIPLSRVPVELVNSAGIVKHQTETAFDGFYIFTGVIAGDYRLKVKDEYLERARYKTPPDVALHISNDTALLSGVDLYLEEKEFKQGYVPYIAKMRNTKLLNLFWEKSKDKPPLSVFNDTAFNLTMKNNFALGLGLFDSLDSAQRVCNLILNQYPDCQIHAHAIEINTQKQMSLSQLRALRN